MKPSSALFPLTISQRYHQETKTVSYEKGKSIDSSKWPESWKRIEYKAYLRFPQILLPKPRLPRIDLPTILIRRESCRSYSNVPISIVQISSLLYYSCGLKELYSKQTGEKRFYPSAGARYPLEVYPCILNVNGISESIYHYHLKTHSLELLVSPPFKDTLLKQFNQEWIKDASMILLITAIFDRTERKYGDRGYRHILTEYGHIAQNLYLLSAGMNIRCCSIGGFVDDGINRLLDLDFKDEGVIGIVVCGNKKEDNKGTSNEKEL